MCPHIISVNQGMPVQHKLDIVDYKQCKILTFFHPLCQAFTVTQLIITTETIKEVTVKGW